MEVGNAVGTTIVQTQNNIEKFDFYIDPAEDRTW